MDKPGMSYTAVHIQVIMIGITQSSLWLLALSWLQSFLGTFNWDKTVILVLFIIREPPKKCEICHPSMQDHQNWWSNHNQQFDNIAQKYTIVHNITIQLTILQNTTENYKVLPVQKIVLPSSKPSIWLTFLMVTGLTALFLGKTSEKTELVSLKSEKIVRALCASPKVWAGAWPMSLYIEHSLI